MLAVDSVDSGRRFSIDWFERKGAYAIVKSEYADLLRETAEAISQRPPSGLLQRRQGAGPGQIPFHVSI